MICFRQVLGIDTSGCHIQVPDLTERSTLALILTDSRVRKQKARWDCKNKVGGGKNEVGGKNKCTGNNLGLRVSNSPFWENSI